MRRTMALRDFFQVARAELTTGSPSATVEMPLANDFRVLLSGDASGVVVHFRNVHELSTGVADPADTAALVESECSQLDENRTDTGWIPAQPSGIRLEVTAGEIDVIIEYTSRTRPG